MWERAEKEAEEGGGKEEEEGGVFEERQKTGLRKVQLNLPK